MISIFIYIFGILIALIIGCTTPITFINKNIYKNNIIFNRNINNKSLFPNILFSNLRIVLSMIVGAFIFSLPTIINLLYNGVLFGFLILYILRSNILLIFLILPHGIFEIPAMMLAGAAGFKIPYEIIRYLMGKKEQLLTKEDIKEYLTLALISIVLICRSIHNPQGLQNTSYQKICY